MSEQAPDKEKLYAEYLNQERWRGKLHRKLAHKGLDIPESDDVNVDNSRVGLGWKEMAVIASTVLGGGYLYQNSGSQSTTPPAVVAPAPVAQPPVDSEYEVLFYDSEGNPISVPHISQLKK